MVLFVWVRVLKVCFFGGVGGVIYYNVFVFNKIEFYEGGFLV